MSETTETLHLELAIQEIDFWSAVSIAVPIAVSKKGFERAKMILPIDVKNKIITVPNPGAEIGSDRDRVPPLTRRWERSVGGGQVGEGGQVAHGRLDGVHGLPFKPLKLGNDNSRPIIM